MKIKSVILILAGTATFAMADGAKLFERCAVCHGEQAEKKSLGVSAVIAGWKEDKIVERLKAYKSKKLNQYGFGNMMAGQATKLNDKEMKEVAHYVSTLEHTQVSDDNSTYSDEVLTPEEMAYKSFVKEYFKENWRYGNIREANKLWEAKKAKENPAK